MYKQLQRNQYGAVAMITVIFIAILLTIMTTGFIRLMINEQRESTDDDLTTRAFYAAESGVEDAIRAIDAKLATTEDCELAYGPGSGELSNENGLDTEFTCQIVDETPSNYEAYLNENQSVHFWLKASEDIGSFTIRWHKYGPKGVEADGISATSRAAGTLTLPQMGSSPPPPPASTTWDDHPAMIRLQLIEVPQEGAERGNIENFVGFLNPATNATTSWSPAALDVPSTAGALDANCAYSAAPDPTGEYFCELTVDSLNPNAGNGDDNDDFDYYLHVTALYVSTHIEVFARGATSGDVVELEDAQVLVDVTGRANDVFRRVEARVNRNQNSMWPDFAILSAESICKDFKITNDPAQFATVAINDLRVGLPRSCVYAP